MSFWAAEGGVGGGRGGERKGNERFRSWGTYVDDTAFVDGVGLVFKSIEGGYLVWYAQKMDGVCLRGGGRWGLCCHPRYGCLCL